MLLFDYLQSHPAVFLATVTVLGLLLGSFLNVVIYRLPVMLQREWRQQCHELLASEDAGNNGADDTETLNLVTPRSRCRQCGHAISALENIPVISYLLLRGKCRACGTPIGIRYPLVELLTGLLSLAVAWHFGYRIETLYALAFTWALVALSFIDIDHQLLPDNITLPLLWAGLLVNIPGTFVPLPEAVIGAATGYAFLWILYQIHHRLTGRIGMGFGDFKLLAALGAWMGWQMLPLILILSSVVGAVIGISLIVFRGRERGLAIPFGPYLSAAGWIAMLWGPGIMAAYLRPGGL